jgi:hypothetical protein
VPSHGRHRQEAPAEKTSVPPPAEQQKMTKINPETLRENQKEKINTNITAHSHFEACVK